MKTKDAKTLPHQPDPLRNDGPLAEGAEIATVSEHDLTVRDLAESHLPSIYRKAAALAGRPLGSDAVAPAPAVPFHPRRETEEAEDFMHRFRSMIVKRLKKTAATEE